jgi:DNA-binding NarL/FixJ family response regulator
MLRETLADLLAREADIEVVGQVDDPVDLLVAVEETEADVVLHTFRDAPELPGICSHLFSLFPHCVVIGLSPDATAAFACRQTVTVKPLLGVGLEEVLAEIRSACAASCGDSP